TSARAYRPRSPAGVGKPRARIRKPPPMPGPASARTAGRARACRGGSASGCGGVRWRRMRSHSGSDNPVGALPLGAPLGAMGSKRLPESIAPKGAPTGGSAVPGQHQLLDRTDRLGRVQALGTGAGAVHDGVAAVELERILEVVQAHAGVLVAA